MSLDNQTTLGDYAPQPRRRQLSRGRKALIGLMAIGAFAAVGGAGTFASFTASTDNAGGALGDGNNPFQTPEVILANTVLDRNDDNSGDPECLSSENVATVDGLTGPLNNAAQCDYVFVANGSIYDLTAELKLENQSTVSGQLSLWAIDPDGTSNAESCRLDLTAPATVNLCDDWRIEIQEYADSADDLTGTTNVAYAEGLRVNGCLVGTAAPTFCDGTTGVLFDSLKMAPDSYNAGSLGAYVNGDNTDTRFFRVRAWLPTTCTDVHGNPPTLDDLTPDGIDDVTGLGCHNAYQNGSASIVLRWVLTAD